MKRLRPPSFIRQALGLYLLVPVGVFLLVALHSYFEFTDRSWPAGDVGEVTFVSGLAALGVITAAWMRHRELARQRAYVHALAERTEQLQSLARELERASITDPLTGLLNRRGFERRLGEACARACAGGAPVSLVLLDLDDFKLVNDRLGHACGDALLQTVARELQGLIRPGDAAVRYGGDEFALVLEGADEAGARLVAERVRRALAGKPLCVGTEPHGRCLQCPRVPCEISIGVAVAEGRVSCSKEDLVRRADRDLYRDKAERKMVGTGHVVPMFSRGGHAAGALGARRAAFGIEGEGASAS